MPSITKYPQTIIHDTHTNDYTSWHYIDGIKNISGSDYGYTNVISAKNGSNPRVSPLILKNFGFNLPKGAKVTSIVVEFGHRKMYKNAYDYPSIGAPTLMLQGTNLSSNAISKTGHTPQSGSFTSKSLKWDGTIVNTAGATVVGNVNVNNLASNQHYDLPTAEQINKSNFGVKISYPGNTSNNQGYLHLHFLRVTINYETPSYQISVTNANDTVYANVEQPIRVTVNNLKLMDYSPTVLITFPVGTEVKSISQSSMADYGSVSISNNVVTWNAKLNQLRGYVDLQINALFTAGDDKTITVVEQDYNFSSSLSFSVLPAMTGIIDISDVDQVIYAKQNTDFIIPIQIPLPLLELDSVTTFYLIPDAAISVKNNNSYTNVSANGYYSIPVTDFDDEGYLEVTAKTSNLGITNIGLSTTTTAETTNFVVKCIPSSLTSPIFTIIQLNSEEIARLGNTITYSVNSSLQISCNTNHISSFQDYYRNFRFGVVNSTNSNNPLEIFESCKKWSDGISTFNTYEEKTVEFNYNEEYPVYILFVGNYPVNDYFTLDFTYPCLVESVKFEGYDTTTIFPSPILNINDSQGLNSVSELDLGLFDKTNSLILYNFPLEYDFGTGNDKAIRGIQVKLDMNVEAPIALIARLKSNTGIVGNRSIIVYPEDTQVILGDEFDLWGFSIDDMVDLNLWELELEFLNNLNGESTFIAIENIDVTAFFIGLKQNKVNMVVDGETMRYYGLFVQKVTLSPGLKTKTKYVEVDGSDLHDPASRNIDKKEIEVEFRVVGCTIEETTMLLREIAKKLTNKCDKLNRPIPKRVEFSHVPGYHFDYILETPIDEDPKTVGYESKVKLTVYDGTSWANKDTVTNTVGSNMSIAKVPPVIQFIPLSSDVEIIETVHNQKLAISNSQFSVNCIVELRCADKKAYMRTNNNEELIDITDSIDWDVDWFILYPGEYSFETNGTCIIQNVIYTERGA